MSILVGNVLSKSIQVSFIDLESDCKEPYKIIIGTDEKLCINPESKNFKYFLQDFRDLQLSHHTNGHVKKVIFSNIGPFSYNSTTFLKGLLIGLGYKFEILDWRKIYRSITERISNKRNGTPVPLTKEEVVIYLHKSLDLLGEQVKYIDTPTKRSRYADAIAFYYFQEYLLNE